MEEVEHNQSSVTTEETLPKERVRRRRSGSSPRWLRHLKKRLKKVRWGALILVLVAAVAVVVVGSLALAADSNNRVSASLSSLERVITSLNTKPRTELTLTDFSRLETSINDVIGSLQTAGRQLGLFRPLSAFDSRLTATMGQLDASLELALAAQSMLNGLRPTLFFLVAGDDEEQVVAQISSGERVVELLQVGRGSFVRAEAHLDQGRRYLDQIDPESLTADLILTADNLDSYHAQLVQANTILMRAPELLTAALGMTEQRSYLILSQNNDELRPSGGYISTFGWMTVRNGRITNYNYSPTTATSPNPPPETAIRQVSLPDWWIRYSQPIYAAWDGSWFADFPSTADMSMWYYNEGNNPQSPVDGVISIDIAGFETVLGALGGVVVPGYDEVVTPENFRQMVYGIRESGQGDLPHKQFVAALYQQIFDEWQNASSDPQISTLLLGEVLEAIQQKHMMFYFADNELNEAINLLGWSGAQEPGRDHDYLLVADANLGNKSNHSIYRQLFYDVDIQTDGTLSTRATVAYDYSDRVASTDPAIDAQYHGPVDYNNLLQVFVPLGSEIESTNNLPQQPRMVNADDHSIIVSRVGVPYDTNARFQFTYRTPVVVETVGPYKRYRLLIQKQPGTIADAANVQITLPANATTIGINPEPAASYDLDRPIVEFRLTLETDKTIEIIYQLPGA
jgi:hypothetical protein